jgi:hypothetical protein
LIPLIFTNIKNLEKNHEHIYYSSPGNMSQDQNNGHPSPKVCVVLPVLEDSRIQVPKASISQWEIYRVIDSLKQALNRTARKKKLFTGTKFLPSSHRQFSILEGPSYDIATCKVWDR